MPKRTTDAELLERLEKHHPESCEIAAMRPTADVSRWSRPTTRHDDPGAPDTICRGHREPERSSRRSLSFVECFYCIPVVEPFAKVACWELKLAVRDRTLMFLFQPSSLPTFVTLCNP